MLNKGCFSLGRRGGKSATSQGEGPQANADGSMSPGDLLAGVVVANLSSSTVIFIFFFPAAGRFLPMAWLSPKDRQKSV